MKGGEIVRVDGGHIVRATGRKDRHSKVYTAKGPRDRRVRLAAHTAIQFYDVQDRLGYDRPSKAVDWLMKKAESAISKLEEVAVAPPWQTGGCSQTPTPESNPSSGHQQESVCGYDLIRNNNSSGNNNNNSSSSFIIATESFFPASNFAGFDNDPSQISSFHAEDLGLSLQPFEGSFQRIDGWNGSRVGVYLNSSQQIFPFTQRELLQSNVAINPWNQRPLIPTNHHDHEHVEARGSKSSSFESPFELGFRVPTRIYGVDEEDNHR